VRQADVVLHCTDATSPDRKGGVFPSLTVGASAVGASVLCVWTKCDLIHPNSLPRSGTCTSAPKGLGLDELRQQLVTLARGQRRRGGLAPSQTRCREHVRRATAHIDAALTLATPQAAELLALELRLALDEVGEMVGAICTDELLDQIFGQFCIGK